jgi:chemotaxis protein methyltransferase CheR
MSLTSQDFDYVRRLLRELSAIVLEDHKGYLVEARLSQLARQEGFASVESLIGECKRQPSGPLHYKVVDAMTTNETSFFRDIRPFEALRARLLPELIGKRAAERRLNVWCAACSSGQEPYSIAMLLDESRAGMAAVACHGHRVLAQRADLFRREYQEGHPRPPAARAEAGRLPVSRSGRDHNVSG